MLSQTGSKKEKTMKKIFALLSVLIIATAVFAYAASDAKPELRPSQKLMQARAAAMAEMNKNLGGGNFEAVANAAKDLSAETKTSGGNNPNPLGKEITLAISSLAAEISSAAAKKDAGAVTAKLGEVKAKCGECHAKIRDKK
jgi:cytochrome c556